VRVSCSDEHGVLPVSAMNSNHSSSMSMTSSGRIEARETVPGSASLLSLWATSRGQSLAPMLTMLLSSLLPSPNLHVASAPYSKPGWSEENSIRNPTSRIEAAETSEPAGGHKIVAVSRGAGEGGAGGEGGEGGEGDSGSDAVKTRAGNQMRKRALCLENSIEAANN
jgi:hypothetical protein